MTPLLTGLDYPDPDVIRVEDTYYMITTTMHFLPGGCLLRSFDLVHWEPFGSVFDGIEDDAAHRLEDGQGFYGKGMWAASLRHHRGVFYVCFVANETRKTYLFRAADMAGPWLRSEIEGFYHDPSLLFEGHRVFIAWGNTEIRLTELKPDLSGPLPGGLDRVVVRETGNPILGYEGCHFYRIQGRYYLFFIHSLPSRWRRVQACFWSDSLEGEFRGGDVLDDDLGYGENGVAQGGLVDTPDGRWFAVLFQDRGAVGRIPVLVPVAWDGPQPVFGQGGRVGIPEVKSTRPAHRYAPLVGSDLSAPLAPYWQWNHNPVPEAWSLDSSSSQLRLRAVQTAVSLPSVRNTLTQRMLFPWCAGEVTIDGRDLREGDIAGLAALQSAYGAIGLRRSAQGYELVTLNRNLEDTGPGGVTATLPWPEPEVRVRVEASFSAEGDSARFSYWKEDRWCPLGPVQPLAFRLDHFVGCRFGLYLLATETTGGEAGFSDFRYRRDSQP